jgi:glycosyltransferase 2 family protein
MLKSGRLWIGIGVSSACLAVVFWQIDLNRVLIALRAANWWALPVIIGSYLVFMLLRAWRWQIMLGRKVDYWPVFHAQSIGYLLTNILPFRLGDLGRAYLVGQQPGLSGLQALSSVVLERILDMLVIVLFFAFTLRMVPRIPTLIAQAGLMFGVLSVTLFAIMLLIVSHRSIALMIMQRALGRTKSFGSEAWLKRADLFLDGLQSLCQWRSLIVILGLSLVDWVTGVAAYYWGIGAFWPEVTWPAAIFTLCAAAFGVSLPSSPSAVGVFHASVWLALSVFSATGEQALGFALVYHALTFIIVLVLGGVGLWKSGHTLREISAGSRKLLSRQRAT